MVVVGVLSIGVAAEQPAESSQGEGGQGKGKGKARQSRISVSFRHTKLTLGP